MGNLSDRNGFKGRYQFVSLGEFSSCNGATLDITVDTRNAEIPLNYVLVSFSSCIILVDWVS